MSLSLDSALRKAQTFEKRNDLVSATAIYQDILARFPANQRAITGYKRLQNNAKSEPSPEQIQTLVTLFNQGQLEATIAQSQTLIDNFPNAVDLWKILGVASARTGHEELAERAFRQVITLNPKSHDAYNNLGNILKAKGLFDDAITAYETALNLSPAYADAHYNLGNVLLEIERCDAAIACFERALHLAPTHADAYNNLGNALTKSGRDEEAVLAFKKSLVLRPNCAETHYFIGNTLCSQDNFADALAHFSTALSLRSDYAEAYNSVGLAHKSKNNLTAATTAFRHAINIQATYADAHYNLGGIHGKQSAFTAAWPEMEWRWQQKGFASEPLLSQKPLWQGGRVERLLVWAEQGIGDEIMFNACLPQIAQQCDRLIVSASKRLIPLFERSFNDITFVEAHNKIDEALYDLQAPALTALGQCRTSLDDFRATATPYLHADAARADTIKSRLKTLAGGAPIIGISWKSMNEKLGKRRSLDLPALAAAIPPDAFLVSLQYGDVAEEIAALKTATGRIVHSYDGVDNFSDLDGFAALVSACDQVISIDNSTVHFAGALGIACHILLPFNPDWRWGLHGTKTSYWYAKTHLHWQPSPNDWQGCIDSFKHSF